MKKRKHDQDDCQITESTETKRGKEDWRKNHVDSIRNILGKEEEDLKKISTKHVRQVVRREILGGLEVGGSDAMGERWMRLMVRTLVPHGEHHHHGGKVLLSHVASC